MTAIIVKKYAITAFLVFFLLTGALGFKTPDDCVKLGYEFNCISLGKECDQLAMCYYEVAITYAFFKGENNKQRAIAYCEKIGEIGSETQVKFDTQRNSCFEEIAVMSKDDSICDRISQTDLVTSIRGDKTSKTICHDKVTKLINAEGKKTCTLLFAMPLFLLLIVTFRIHNL